jgi:hypothetical protein
MIKSATRNIDAHVNVNYSSANRLRHRTGVVIGRKMRIDVAIRQPAVRIEAHFPAGAVKEGTHEDTRDR